MFFVVLLPHSGAGVPVRGVVQRGVTPGRAPLTGRSHPRPARSLPLSYSPLIVNDHTSHSTTIGIRFPEKNNFSTESPQTFELWRVKKLGNSRNTDSVSHRRAKSIRRLVLRVRSLASWFDRLSLLQRRALSSALASPIQMFCALEETGDAQVLLLPTTHLEFAHHRVNT